MIDEIQSGLRKFLGTLFFLGYIPGSPSTLGALAMIGLLWLGRVQLNAWLIPANLQITLFVATIVLLCASWLANDSQKNFGSHNAPPLIIDIFLGQFIVFLFVPISLSTLLMGFILYRFFGIIKPWPIYPFDDIEEGVGIVMDDVIAGIAAAIALQGMLYTYGYVIGYLR